MKCKDTDPTEAWKWTKNFYVDFVAMQGWDFLFPMIDLVEWVAQLPMAKRLYPGTSHANLTVSLAPGYPSNPFFATSCDRQIFRFELFSEIGMQVNSRDYSLSEPRTAFCEFVSLLESIPRKK